MASLSIDFETRSVLDVSIVGTHKYVEHPSTGIICMAYAFGDRPVRLWRPGVRVPRTVIEWIQAGAEMRAWNAAFERLVWRVILTPQYGFPEPAIYQWHCTAAEAAAMALPRSLDECAEVLKTKHQKDTERAGAMRRLTVPKKVWKSGQIEWNADPQDLKDCYEYCRQDVRTERAVAKRVRRLSEHEREVYLMDQRMNDRGVLIDVPLVHAAQRVVEHGTNLANAELEQITDGVVTAVTQTQRIKNWANEHGAELPDLKKHNVRDVLLNQELPGVVERVLQIRADAGKTSNAKLKAALRTMCEDARCRGMFLYHGAGPGRWTGKGLQPQNFPRPELEDANQYITNILEGTIDEVGHHPLVVVSSCLRGIMRAAPGHEFFGGDFSQIEARVLGWIANEPYGKHEYEKMAAAIYAVPVKEIIHEYEVEHNGDRRKMGKDTVLGCGFQMGGDRFREQAFERSGVRLTQEFADKAVATYRREKPGVVRFWSEIEDAAMHATRNPGKRVFCGAKNCLTWLHAPPFLWCVLPSGRALCYALPRIRMVKVKPKDKPEFSTLALQFTGVDGYTRRWTTRTAYGGFLTENVVQATARDLIADSMLRLEAAGYPPVLTVHDEAVCEVPKGQGNLDEFLEIMAITPDWAKDCPVECEGWQGDRFRK